MQRPHRFTRVLGKIEINGHSRYPTVVLTAGCHIARPQRERSGGGKADKTEHTTTKTKQNEAP